MKTLRPKHRAFAEAYAKSGNATTAAKLAGYAPASAKNAGYRCLKRPGVLAYLERLKSSGSSPVTQATARVVVSERSPDVTVVEAPRPVIGGHILSRGERLALLSSLAIDPGEATALRIKAIDVINKMERDYILDRSMDLGTVTIDVVHPEPPNYDEPERDALDPTLPDIAFPDFSDPEMEA